MCIDGLDSAGIPDGETGVQAVWLLYKWGRWGYLEDLGVERREVEDGLRQFEVDNVVSDHLTRAQAKRLAKKLPVLQGASVELRLAYALKQIDEGVRIGG